jgi:hypothetical protein
VWVRSEPGSIISRCILILVILLSGCTDHALDKAEQLIAAYDFKEALAVLDQIEAPPRDVERYRRLKALSLFVEGDADSGFAWLEQRAQVQPEVRQTDARILVDAARIIVREKNRCPEAIRLLDSCYSFNPDLKNEIVELAWERALEYLSLRGGNAGYQLIEFLTGIDESIGNRLRSHNRIFYRRYEEIRNLHQVLAALRTRVDMFIETYGRPPSNYAEFNRERFTLGIPLPKGWRFEIEPGAGSDCLLYGEALKDNPGGVPAGSIIEDM